MPKGLYTRPSVTDRLWARVDKTDGCWPWTGRTDKNGYGKITVGGRTERAHRLAWTLTFGLIPEGQWVLHACDNPPCCRPDHLYLGDVLRNTRDASARGLLTRGSDCHRSKLTQADVIEIRSRYAAGGIVIRALGREYGVTPNAVHMIVRRQSWKHV